MSNVTNLHRPRPVLPETVGKAIVAQQDRVLHLVGILECLRIAADQAPNFDAALSGAKELADDIYSQLDPAALSDAAAKLQEGP